MRATSKLLALALTAALQPAVAGVVALNFEDITGVSKLGNQYAASGVAFTGNAWGVASALNDCDGLWLFAKADSCGALLLGDPLQSATSNTLSFTIDVAGGFVNAFNFVYGIRSGSNVTIRVFDDVGGHGTALRTLNGLTGGGCTAGGIAFCQWHNGSVSFEGTARSVTISGVDQRLMLDDLQFTPAAGTPLPEPTSIALALGALGAAGWTRRRATR